MSEIQETNVGAIVSLQGPEEGDIYWVATQEGVGRSLPPGRGRPSIDWSFGPIKITGYIDTDTFEIGVTVSVAGITVGNIFGNLKDGVGLKIDLFVAKGEIRLYLKNGNEVWVHYDLKISFDGSYQGDAKIFSF
ncbi:hypothetical protein V8C40DRAFT_284188 [Trichoderma camerunense]